jgi:hypothetical protein
MFEEFEESRVVCNKIILVAIAVMVATVALMMAV